VTLFHLLLAVLRKPNRKRCQASQVFCAAIEGPFTVGSFSFGVFASGVERLLQGWDALLAQSKSAMMAAPSVHAQAKLHRE
jgi:hypothetical protein